MVNLSLASGKKKYPGAHAPGNNNVAAVKLPRLVAFAAHALPLGFLSFSCVSCVLELVDGPVCRILPFGTLDLQGHDQVVDMCVQLSKGVDVFDNGKI